MLRYNNDFEDSHIVQWHIQMTVFLKYLSCFSERCLMNGKKSAIVSTSLSKNLNFLLILYLKITFKCLIWSTHNQPRIFDLFLN